MRTVMLEGECVVAVNAAVYVAAQTEAPPAPVALAATEIVPASAAQPESAAPHESTTRSTRDAKPGKLSINTRPWSTVYLGNRVLGTTPLAGISVPRSALTLKLVDRDGNVHLRRLARSKAMERTAFYDFPQPTKRAKKR